MKIACRSLVMLLAFLVVFLPGTFGQPQFKVQYYSTEQGLSHQAVTCILKDKEGFVWFGTWGGINRFDGHDFVPHNSVPGDNSILGSSRVDQMVEDQSGHIWMQAYDKRIYCFDKKSENFLQLSPVIDTAGNQKISFLRILSANDGMVWLESEKEGLFCLSQENFLSKPILRYNKNATADHRLPSDRINFFHIDVHHQVWVGTAAGLCLLAKSSSGDYKISHKIPVNITRGMSFTVVAEDEENLYFGTRGGEMVVYHQKTSSFQLLKIASSPINALLRSKKRNVIYASTSSGEIVTVNPENNKTTVTTYNTGEQLYKMFEDHTGLLWIEPEKKGIISLDPQSGSYKLFVSNKDETLNYIGNRFRVLEDNNRVLWINMKGGGFGYYNTETHSFEDQLQTRDAGTYKLPKFVYTIFYDKAGVLWLTTNEREIIKIVSLRSDFKQQFLVDPGNVTVDNEARGILWDNQNRLWVGAKRGRLHTYNSNLQVTDLLLNEPVAGLGGVYSILQDKRGNIWLGTKGNGLYKASPVNREQTKYELHHIPLSLNDGGGLPCKEIYALMEDPQGRIWIGSYDKGLYVATIDKDSTRFVYAGNMYKNYPKENINKIRNISLGRDGNIWVGTTNGLLILNAAQTGTPEQKNALYTKIPGDKESLGNNDIQFIFCDSKSRMWIASSGGGLCLAIGRDPLRSLRFRNYTVTDGMPNNYVLACAEDKEGHLWLSTENGLSRFNFESQLFKNYNSYNGLPKLRFSEAAASRRFLDGRLVFGTNKGFLSFAPDYVNENRIAANIALTNLQINNEDESPGKNEGVLINNINYTSELTLRHNQDIISIDYAVLDYRGGNNRTCAYRIIGFDSVWHTDGQLGRATYTNLPPGHYVFQVKSLNNDLYVNVPYRSLAITVLPPPWKTWWAYSLYCVIALILLVFIRKYALKMARLRQGIAVERKLTALKLDFFTNVSHELRTPLTLILSPLDQLLRKEKLSEKAISYVEVARKNATRMERFINQLLDLRKVQSEKAVLNISRVELVSFVGRVGDHFTEAVSVKQLKLVVASDEKEIFALVDAEKLEVVIYNLLGNAIKYTPEGKLVHVHIQTMSEDHSILIMVSDQGPGVAKEKLEQIFELFYGGDQAVGGPKGTGIGLSLSKEFINLHGGKIWAANNENGGLTVTVKLKHDQVLDEKPKKAAPITDVEPGLIIGDEAVQQPLQPYPRPVINDEQHQSLVLVVEDNDELRAFITGQLSEFYRVESAADGEEGFQKTISLMPDLVVSDIMMPKMDGIQLLDKIKNDVNTSHIPVVLLSAKYSVESQINGLRYGADCYITKPFNNEFLVASISNLLRQRKKLFQWLLSRSKETTPQVESPAESTIITSKDKAFLKEVICIVENKMTDTNFNIETIAEGMAMSRTTFYKKFKSLTGTTIVEFVRDVRLQRAKQLLENGDSNISEVAFETGFSSPSYFSTCFREKYKIAPSDFIKSKRLP